MGLSGQTCVENGDALAIFNRHPSPANVENQLLKARECCIPRLF
ncbi:hypothetical protein BN137_545 [Cronobacter condimenti 1330]|uniref:Uncharacterized protein n=1 Tax=Cronobacter condimenti 1330 TaxID=1073999 RepID=K7ZXS5_9ENTR|nr:hypothetical protein BN137_545 [Cronobacter condimenti 1330]